MRRASCHAGDASIFNEFDRVRPARIFRDRGILEINVMMRFVVRHVFQCRSETQRIKKLWFASRVRIAAFA